MQTKTINKNLAIYQFLETQLEVFKGYFIVTRAIQDEEAIHQMRVAIKRIRSIRKLKEHINFPGIFNAEQYNNVKTLFAVSGQMRDIHVQQKLLKKFSKELNFEFEDFNTFLLGLETKQKLLLKQNLRAFNLHQLDHRENGTKFPEDNIDLERESFGFLNKKLERINQLIKAMDQDEFVHDLRKQVKHLFFILHFFSDYFPERDIGTYDTKNLKIVGEKLGAWNDRQVFNVRLENFISNMNENYLKVNTEYRRLLEYLEEEKQKYLHGVDDELSRELEKIRLLVDNGDNQEK